MSISNIKDVTPLSPFIPGAVGYLLKDAFPAEIINAVESVYRGYSPVSGKIARRIFEEFHDIPNEESHNENDLTNREREVLSILSKGYTLKQIAKDLRITYEGVRSHLKHIYKKLHANSQVDAINKAKDMGLIENKNE